MKAAATTFRANPAFDTEKAIMELGIGEALVSTLDGKGQPTIVERTLVKPPNSRVAPINDEERAVIIKASKRDLDTDYTKVVDRDSAYEMLQKRTAKREDEAAAQAEQKAAKKTGGGSRSDSLLTVFLKELTRSVFQTLRQILPGLLKSFTRR